MQSKKLSDILTLRNKVNLDGEQMKKSFFKQQFASIIRNDEETTNDELGAYPERLHVSAFPERRYLKTSRVIAISIFITIFINMALAFIYTKLASEGDANIYDYAHGGVHLYQVDMYNRKIKQVELPHTKIGARHLLSQTLIEEYLIQRFEVSTSYNEMLERWNSNSNSTSFLHLTSADSANLMPQETSRVQLDKVKNKLVEEIYIYSIRQIHSNFYEVIYDLFTTKQTSRGEKVCITINRDLNWLDCLRKNAIETKRYKAFIRVSYTPIPERNREQILKNPYHFQVTDIHIFPLPIHKNNPWTDVDVLEK